MPGGAVVVVSIVDVVVEAGKVVEVVGTEVVTVGGVVVVPAEDESPQVAASTARTTTAKALPAFTR